MPTKSFRVVSRSVAWSGVGVAWRMSWFFASSITTSYDSHTSLTPTRASGVRMAVSGVAEGVVSRLLVSDPSRDASITSFASLPFLDSQSRLTAYMIALISDSLTTGAGRFSFARFRVTPACLSRRLSCIIASGRLLSVMRLNR